MFGFPKLREEQLPSVAASPQQASGQLCPERGKPQLLFGGEKQQIRSLHFNSVLTALGDNVTVSYSLKR